MTYRLIIMDTRIWQRDCNRIPEKDLRRIIERIQCLQEHPLPTGVDVKKLQHYNAADFRLRIGDYRVLFNKNDDVQEIHLLRILHRSKSY